MRHAFALAIAAVLVSSPPALALVEDRAGALGPAETQRLESALSALAPGSFEVVLVERAPGGAVAAAERRFAERSLGPEDAVIVVATGERTVGVSLGEAYAERGLNAMAIDRLVAEHFVPRARAGDYAGAAAALAAALDRAEPGALAPADPAPSFPWWLLVLPLAAAGGWLLFRRRPARGPDLAPRLAGLRERHAAMLASALRLDEAGTLGRFHAGGTAATYRSLGGRAGELLGAASRFGAALDEAEAAWQGGQHDRAEARLAALEQEAAPIEAELAASVTALDAMADDDVEARERLALARSRLQGLAEAGARLDMRQALEARLAEAEALAAAGDPTSALAAAESVHGDLDRIEGVKTRRTPAVAWAELPDQAEDLARRMQELAEAYAHERERAETFGLPGDPRLEGRLREARRALATPPVDMATARQALKEAAEALARYHDAVEAEADRVAKEPQAPMPHLGWGMGPPIILLRDLGGHLPRGGFGGPSGGGSWGGSSGGGSWGGPSGGGKW
ncbi:MAG: TPM domain-containing protein [Candidatus Sericytochromatia bacterium]